MSLVVLPRQIIPDINGAPRVGAKLYLYDVTTTDEHPSYSTSAMDVALTYPIESLGNGYFPAVYVDPDDGDYKVVIKDAADVVIYTEDLLKPFDVGAVAIGNALYPITAAETSSGVTVVYSYYPPGDLRRYGIVPNSSSAATANTAAAKQLMSPEINAAGYVGDVWSPNTTGSDIYYFNDVITLRRGIRLDMCGTTWRFDKSGSDANAVNAGLLYWVADVGIQNGTIDVHWADAPSGQGYALVIGSRSAAGTLYFPNHYDSLLSYKQGNGYIRDVTLKSDAANSRLGLLLGGVRNVNFDNINLDGQSTGVGGIYGEWGWATYNADASLRETSHPHNLRFTNIQASGLKTGAEDYAVWINGGYGITIDGLHVRDGYGSAKAGLGEANNYRPWAGNDDGLVKRNVFIRNVSHEGGAGTSIDVTGSQASSGYLATLINALGHPADYDALTDNLDAVLDNITVTNCAGYGVLTSAGKIAIRNAHLRGNQRGIVMTEDCTDFLFDNVVAVNSTSYGMQLGNGTTNYGTARKRIGIIRGGKVAGNGTSGTVAGILLSNTNAVLVEGVRLGYELSHDAVDETTQAQGINAQSTCRGVRVVGCYGGGTSGGAVMYNLASSGPDGRACVLINCEGVSTYTGLWGDGVHALTTQTYGASMTPDCQINSDFLITANNGTAFTINAPTNMRYGQRITITIRNTSGGVLGTITWDAVFKMAAFTKPADGFSASIDFRWNATNWVEVARGGTTVPN